MAIKSRYYFPIYLLLTLFALTIVSCEETISEEDCATYNYYDCNTIKPIEADLKFKFSLSPKIKMVAFEIYKGNIEQNNIIIRDTAKSSTVTYIMPIPEYYSARAIYKEDGKTIYVVDGVKMDVKSVQKCDSVCWKDSNEEMDLTLQ